MSSAPSTPTQDPQSAEACAICNRDPGSSAFCHLYREGRRIVLCSPQCAELFLEREAGESNGYDDPVIRFSPPAATR